jgi:hypothetical protein
MIQQAILGTRLIALLIGIVALWFLSANLAESITAFDPNYLGHFFASEILRPGIGLLLSLLLFVFSKPVGHALMPKD